MKLEVTPKIKFNCGAILAGVVIPDAMYTQYSQFALYGGSLHSRLEILEELLKSGLALSESNEGYFVINNSGEFCSRPLKTGVISQDLIMPVSWRIPYSIIDKKGKAA